VIPLRDQNPTSRAALVTLGLIVANVLVFFTEPLTGSDVAQARFFLCKAAIPAEVTRWHQLPGIAQQLSCPGKNVLGSIVYSMFLHGGILHIAGNMLFLWVFGNNVEDRLGRARFLLFYFACGFAATLAQSYVTSDSTTPMVGASGAVAGVLGAYLLMFPRARVTTIVFWVATDLPAAVVLGGWFVLQLFSSVGSVRGGAGGIAYVAHIGGFIAGMLLLLLLRPRRAAPSPPLL
jgi:membrane associated rhomboid family serine protease